MHTNESMRMGMVAAVAALSVVLQGSVAAAAATKHVVGGATGWTIPTNASFYSDWASSQTFTAGDSLVFNFTTGIHNVMQVAKAGYDGCSGSSTVGATLTTGPATVTLTSPGAHYYICGVPTHCSLGQKLAVTVSAAGGPSPSPSPSPSKAAAPAPPPGGPAPAAPTPPSSSTPAPSSEPGAAPPPGSSSSAAPSPSSSAPSAVWLLALLAAAAGGFAQH